MYDLMSVAVLYGAYYLLEELASSYFGHLSVFHQVVEQLSSRIFQYHDDIRGGCDDGKPVRC